MGRKPQVETQPNRWAAMLPGSVCFRVSFPSLGRALGRLRGRGGCVFGNSMWARIVFQQAEIVVGGEARYNRIKL